MVNQALLPPKPSSSKKIIPRVMRVKQHKPWLCPTLVGTTIMGMVGLGLFLYLNSIQILGESKQSIIERHLQEQEEHRQDFESIAQENASLRAQNKELRKNFAMMVGKTQEGQNTYSQTLKKISDLLTDNSNFKKELSNLKEELSIYKRLLSSPNLPKYSTQNVVVGNFTLNYDKKNERYLYKLILIQWTKKAKMAQGLVEINALGKANGNTSRLSMKQLTGNTIEAMKYELIYFQRIENNLQLPKDFIPHHLIVRLKPKGQNKVNEIRIKWENLQPKEQS